MDIFDSFTDYIGKVKADTELKENTQTYIRNALAQKSNSEAKNQFNATGVKRRLPKKIVASAFCVMALAMISISGYAYYTPVNYVSLDINPSVELGLNMFDTVVSVEGINYAGQNLIKGQHLTYMSVSEAIQALISEAGDQNFIAENGSTVIAITLETKNDETIASLQSDCEKSVQLALDAMDLDAVIYNDYAGLEIHEDAQKLGVSPGKLNLIRFMQELNPEITIDQYQDAMMTDIIVDTNELLKDQADDLPDLADQNIEDQTASETNITSDTGNDTTKLDDDSTASEVIEAAAQIDDAKNGDTDDASTGDSGEQDIDQSDHDTTTNSEDQNNTASDTESEQPDDTTAAFASDNEATQSDTTQEEQDSGQQSESDAQGGDQTGTDTADQVVSDEEVE